MPLGVETSDLERLTREAEKLQESNALMLKRLETHQELETVVESLRKDWPEDKTTLRRRALHTYRAKIVMALDSLTADEALDPSTLLTNLETLLANNWDLVKGSLLSYTAIPTDEVTELLCDVAEFVSEKTGKPAIQLLMPGVAIESGEEEMPDGAKYIDIDKLDLKQVLRKHVEAFDSQYLLPVESLLYAYPASPTQKVNRQNPYWDTVSYDTGTDELDITDSQLARLAAHSETTKTYVKLHQKRQALSSGKNNLYERLASMLHSMYMNSKNAGGSEEIAGEDFYTEFREFIQFYDGLELEAVEDDALEQGDVEQIPKSVDDEIQHLKRVMGNRYKSDGSAAAHFSDVDLCLASRHEKLQPLVEKHKSHLQLIALGDEAQQQLLQTCEEEFAAAHRQLIEELTAGKYSGSDSSLGLSLGLLTSLDLELKITSFDDVVHFVSMPQEDMQTFLAENKHQEAIFNAMRDMSDWVMLMYHLSAEKMKIFFAAVGQSFFEKVLTRQGELDKKLGALLVSLPIGKAKIILDTLHANLTRRVTSFYDLDELCGLRSEQLAIFIGNIDEEEIRQWSFDCNDPSRKLVEKRILNTLISLPGQGAAAILDAYHKQKIAAITSFIEFFDNCKLNLAFYLEKLTEADVQDWMFDDIVWQSYKDLGNDGQCLDNLFALVKDKVIAELYVYNYKFDSTKKKLIDAHWQQVLDAIVENPLDFLGLQVYKFFLIYQQLDAEQRQRLIRNSSDFFVKVPFTPGGYEDFFGKLDPHDQALFFKISREVRQACQFSQTDFIEMYKKFSDPQKEVLFKEKSASALFQKDFCPYRFSQAYNDLLPQHQTDYVNYAINKLLAQIGKKDDNSFQRSMSKVLETVQGDHVSMVQKQVGEPFEVYLEQKKADASAAAAPVHSRLSSVKSEAINPKDLVENASYFCRVYKEAENDAARSKLLDTLLSAPVAEQEKFFMKTGDSWISLYLKLNDGDKTQLVKEILDSVVHKTYGWPSCNRIMSILSRDHQKQFAQAMQADILKMKPLYSAVIEGTRSVRACVPASQVFDVDGIEPEAFVKRFFEYCDAKPNSLLSQAWTLYSTEVKNRDCSLGDENQNLQTALERCVEKNSWGGSSASFWGSKQKRDSAAAAGDVSRHQGMMRHLGPTAS
ncbi:MAG: hypothetical protein K0U23_00235 [Gammaproteobacteria bacterium]|nr:hypothetical protein [Gammaproteobacteria bacterium]